MTNSHASVPTFSPASSPASGVSLLTQQYATEQALSYRVDLRTQWASQARPEGVSLPTRELWFDSFFESGQAGDRGFDFDVAVIRLATGSTGHLWFGRTHPWLEDRGLEDRGLEDRGLERRSMPLATGALGANWVQNQGTPLSPRVVGWVGAGWSGTTEGGLTITALMSPLYLPSSGARVEFSENSAAQGSRFGTLPPAYLKSNGQYIPVRYRIETGDITKIVLQQQVYLSVGTRNEETGLRVFAWSAPAPSPSIEATGKLRVDSDLDELNALVTATPSFPRETTLGFQWELGPRQRFSDLQLAYQPESGRLTLSAEFRPVMWARLGALHRVETRDGTQGAGAQAADADAPVPTAQPYTDRLLWTEIERRFVGNRLQGLLRFERHFAPEREGFWLRPILKYSPDARLGMFAHASLIVGKNGSYFGQWRSLDSMATGVSYQW